MDPATETDGELVRRARGGSAPALRALFERHESALKGFLDRRLPAGLRRKVAPEDILQEAWLVANARLAEFEDRGEGAFRAWLMRIAEFKLREAVRAYLGTRKRADVREVSRGGRPDTSAFLGDSPSPSEVAQGNEMRDAAAKAMATLPDDYREVLRLVQVEGLTLKLAAERMGRSHEAVKKLYGRALARFAALLGHDKKG
jgi:RNA polymerase sigma-70 factor (ECF subfamily)